LILSINSLTIVWTVFKDGTSQVARLTGFDVELNQTQGQVLSCNKYKVIENKRHF
jgi:hypothetical protein